MRGAKHFGTSRSVASTKSSGEHKTVFHQEPVRFVRSFSINKVFVSANMHTWFTTKTY